MSDNWVTLQIIHDEIQANLMKGYLENAGIICVIEPSILRGQAEYLGSISSSFKINVPKAQIQLAQKILADFKE